MIAQHAGPTAAQAVAKFFAFQWHADGLSPYIVFEPVTDHGDAAIDKAQSWLSRHFSVANPVEQAARISGIPERSFKRRFKSATGHAPIDYVQRLRVEEAKRRLERTRAPVDEISWKVGYEDPAFFRRLFKRITGVTAGAYRRKFRIPRLKSFEKRPASTFSWPTISANVMMRSATSSGCSTSFAVLPSLHLRQTRKPPLLAVSDMLDELFVRVDPWLGLRFNLAMNKKIALVLILLFGAGLNSFAQTNSTPGAPTAGIVAAAKKFLATLDDAQRGKVVFDFKDEAQRKRWSNFPT